MISVSHPNELVVEPFTRADLRLLFPLMAMAEPSLDLKHWLAYATPLARRRDGRAGVLVARRNVRRFPCGAVCYHVVHDLRLGPVLTAEHFIALDLVDPHAVLMALAAQLDSLARQLGCTAVRAMVQGNALCVDLRRTGLDNDGVVLIKQLAALGTAQKTEYAQLPR